MGINAGRFHGVGVRPAFEPTFSGVLEYSAVAGNSPLQASVVMNSDAIPAPVALTIQDVGAGSGTVPLVEILNGAGAELLSIDGEGNVYCYNKLIGAAPGVFGPFLQFDGATSTPSLLVAGTNRIFIAAGAPAGITGIVNDWWYRTDATSAGTYFYQCTGAGTPGTWTAFI